MTVSSKKRHFVLVLSAVPTSRNKSIKTLSSWCSTTTPHLGTSAYGSVRLPPTVMHGHSRSLVFHARQYSSPEHIGALPLTVWTPDTAWCIKHCRCCSGSQSTRGGGTRRRDLKSAVDPGRSWLVGSTSPAVFFSNITLHCCLQKRKRCRWMWPDRTVCVRVWR